MPYNDSKGHQVFPPTIFCPFRFVQRYYLIISHRLLGLVEKTHIILLLHGLYSLDLEDIDFAGNVIVAALIELKPVLLSLKPNYLADKMDVYFAH